MSCKYYINSKNRRCLNPPMRGKSYCHSHKLKIKRDKEKSKKEQIAGGNVMGSSLDDPYISPYALVSSQLAPNPPQQSWYHYQAPVYQTFGDYVCIKKSFLNNARALMKEVFPLQSQTLKT